MRTIALIICLVLLAVAGVAILVFGFGTLGFNLGDFLYYVGFGVVIYLIVRVVGWSLNRRFNAAVEAFLRGETSSPFNDPGLLKTFGLLLIVLLPFLLYLFLLAIYSALIFGRYGLLLVTAARRIPVAVVIGLAIVAIGTTIGVLMGVYYLFRPPRRKTLGLEIEQGQQKGLWQVVGEIADAIKARPITKILITPDPGIGVYQEGNVFVTVRGGGERVLEIGLPSVHNLTVDEFKAILAHEYGHFSNRDTQWSAFTYSMGSSLVSAYRSVPGPPREGSTGRISIITVIMFINPAYWILHVFVGLFFRITNGFSRIREVMADVMAMELFGGKAFAGGLEKVVTNDTVFMNMVHAQYVPQLLKEKKLVSDFSKAMDSVYQQLDEDKIAEIRKMILEESQIAKAFDSHPALQVRLDYSKRFSGTQTKDERPVSVLFEHWDKLNEEATNLYNMRMIHFMRQRGGQ